VAFAQRPMVSFSFNIPVAGWGIPKDQGTHSDSGQLILTANGVSTIVYFSFAGIEGDDPQTKIEFIVAYRRCLVFSGHGQLHPVDPTGRSGTATLQFGTGAFHDASAAITYDFTCTSGCPQGIQAPYPLPFDGILTGTGSLFLPTSVAQVILPTLFPPPPGFLVPAGITAGANVPVILTAGGFPSAPVTVAIR
jgi:hypothetical protein